MPISLLKLINHFILIKMNEACFLINQQKQLYFEIQPMMRCKILHVVHQLQIDITQIYEIVITYLLSYWISYIYIQILTNIMRATKEQHPAQQQPTLAQFLSSAPQLLSEQLELNISLRLKFGDETQKFYQSEEQIHETLTTLQSKLEETEDPPQTILTQLIDSKILVPLLKTLDHPNLDINISAIKCYYSLIIDMSEEIEQADQDTHAQKGQVQGGAFAIFFRMALWFVQNGLVQALVRVLAKCEEQKIEEYEACTKILKILQSLIELSNTVFEVLIRDTEMVKFLTNRIMPNFTVSHRIIDDNKFICSDLLLSLLQTPPLAEEQNMSAVRQFYKFFGIEVLVETISSYENKLPTEIDEREYLSNLFGCLNVMMVAVKESRKQFAGMKGLYLMVGYICNKTEYAVAALKSISNCLDIETEPTAASQMCSEIANDGSLKYIFPIAMMQGLKGRDSDEQTQINQHVLRILYFLVCYSQGVTRDRIVFKFIEKRFAKLERIFQIAVEYLGGVGSEHKQKQKEKGMKIEKGELDPEEYIRLVKDQGLGLVEICAKIIVTIWSICPKSRQRILALMPLYSLRPDQLQTIVQRNYKFIDQGQQKQHLARLLATSLREIQQAK